MNDMVNHPPHYTKGGIEVIDIIESIVGSMELTPVESALTAQVVKYIARWKNKGGVEDLSKAQWYLKRLIGKLDPGTLEVKASPSLGAALSACMGNHAGISCTICDFGKTFSCPRYNG